MPSCASIAVLAMRCPSSVPSIPRSASAYPFTSVRLSLLANKVPASRSCEPSYKSFCFPDSSSSSPASTTSSTPASPPPISGRLPSISFRLTLPAAFGGLFGKLLLVFISFSIFSFKSNVAVVSSLGFFVESGSCVFRSIVIKSEACSKAHGIAPNLSIFQSGFFSPCFAAVDTIGTIAPPGFNFCLNILRLLMAIDYPVMF